MCVSRKTSGRRIVKEEREGAKSKPKEEDGRCVLCSGRGGGTTCYVVHQYPEIMCLFDGKFIL